MLHVAHLTSAHNADDVRIFHKECKALREAGFRVSLVAPDRYNDTDVDYAGVELEPVEPGTRRVERMTKTTLRVLRKAIQLNADVYHIHDAELLPGLWALKAMGAKTVYDVHEDLTKDVLIKKWIPLPIRSLTAKMSGRFETLSSMVFDGIVAATKGIGGRFPSQKTIVLHNYPHLSDDTKETTFEEYLQRPRDFVYAGLRTQIRGLHHMIDAMQHLEDSKFQCFGNPLTGELLEHAQASPGWPATCDRGWAPRTKIMEYYQEARAGMLAVPATPAAVESQPIKFYEYMGAGLPVVASDFPLWRELVEKERCGVLVEDPTDPQSIAKAMQWILDHPKESYEMGQRGKAAVKDRYNWQVESQKLIGFYQELAAA